MVELLKDEEEFGIEFVETIKKIAVCSEATLSQHVHKLKSFVASEQSYFYVQALISQLFDEREDDIASGYRIRRISEELTQLIGKSS
jgi:hypothetical protein